MRKITPSDWFIYIAKLIGMLAIPTLLCSFTVSFKAAFQTWALLLSFLIPFISGLLIIFNYVWKDQKFAFFLRAVVIGISFFTASVVGMAMDISGSREILPDLITTIFGITFDSHATVLRQILFTSAIVGIIGSVGVVVFTLFSQSMRLTIKDVVKDVIKEM